MEMLPCGMNCNHNRHHGVALGKSEKDWNKRWTATKAKICSGGDHHHNHQNNVHDEHHHHCEGKFQN